MRKSAIAVAAAALMGAIFLSSPRDVLAQACTGVLTNNGQYAVAGGLGFEDGSKSFGLEGMANLAGPFTVGASYSLTTFDDADPNGNTFGASAAYDMPLTGTALSACPTTGIEYMRVSDEGSAVSLLTIPVGIALGTTLEGANGFTFVPYAVPQFMYLRTSISGDGFEDVTDSTTEFGTELGTAFAGDKYYAALSALITTVEGSDPSFAITVGVITP